MRDDPSMHEALAGGGGGIFRPSLLAGAAGETIVPSLMNAQTQVAHSEIASIRDTVESIWIAIVLAFLLRAFLVEAFVIPTGSMAPTLMGAHWRLRCQSCGRKFAYGMPKTNGYVSQEDVFSGARCPNCRYPYTSYGETISRGDHVLVMKYLYHLDEPKPWDVVVFKNPQNNRENYIKRLIGLPGEEIEIVHGDVFVRNWLREEETFHIRRKPLRTQETMWQVVYNNDYQPDIEKHFGPAGGRRVPVPRWVAAADTDVWDLTGDGGREFTFHGSEENSTLELDVQLWPEVRGEDRLEQRWQRELFLPRYGYNVTSDRPGEGYDLEDAALATVSDLKLSVVLWPGKDACTLNLGLTSFDHEFRAEVSSDGSAEVFYRHMVKTEGKWVGWGEAANIPAMRQGVGHRLSLAYVDQQLVLQVDGEAVIQRTTMNKLANGKAVPLMDHESLKSYIRAVHNGTAEVRIPQPTIAVRGGACRLNHVHLMRDVHYTNTKLQPLAGDSSGIAPEAKYADTLGVEGGEDGWATFGKPIRLAHHARGERPRSMDEFFVLGDNSPQSLDGRGWTSAAPTLRLYSDEGRPMYTLGTVPRYNMLGKAFFVYWPAGFRVPGLKNLQIIPNVGKVRLIR